MQNKRERKPPPEKIYKLKLLLLPLCACCTKHVAKLALALATTNGIAKFFPKSRRNAVKNTLQGKTKGANSKNKISGRVKKNNVFFRYYPLQNKVAFAINLRQVAKHCTLHFTLVLCSKKRFFRYYPLQNKVTFCKNMRQVAKHCILHFTLVAVFKETFFSLLPIAKQSCFCNKPATIATSCKTPYFALHACGCGKHFYVRCVRKVSCYFYGRKIVFTQSSKAE